MLNEQLSAVLRDFSALIGQELSVDEDSDTIVFTVDEEVVINLRYLEASDTLVMFSLVGELGSAAEQNSPEKALALLHLTDISQPTGQVTLALDEEAQLLLAMDRRSALYISSADALAAWLEVLVNTVREVREYFALHFPVAEEK
ncbi:MAG: type III secretion system chaperone [Succinivibrio sp.]|nr:type III secretion system chaperone [Succinivibrio sp.]